MSITTKRGDDGQTDLMYGRRVPKTDERVEAYGAVDELNAALGLARAHGAISPQALAFVSEVQERLIGLMGELATAEADMERYRADGYAGVDATHVEWVEGCSRDMERTCDLKFKDWARPGGERCPVAAHLDLARTICRRAERRVCGLLDAERLSNLQIMLFLNRLSDALWVFARHEALLRRGGE